MPQMIGGIVAETAVAVNFAEIGEQALDVVERLRTLGMPRQFGFLPGGLRGFHLLPRGCGRAREVSASWRCVSSFCPASASISATCRSISSNSCCAFCVASMI